MDDAETPARRFELSSQLALLRRRFGNNIADVLLEYHGGVEGDRQEELSVTVSELLVWAPKVGPSPKPYQDVLPLEAKQLVDASLPSALVALGDAIHSGVDGEHSDALQQSLLALGKLLYPALLSRTDPHHERPTSSIPLAAGEHRIQADSLLRAEGLFPERVGHQAFQGNSSFNEYGFPETRYEPSELLIHAAWELCLFRAQISSRDLGVAISEGLSCLRAAKSGGETFVPVFLCFAGSEVSEPFEVDRLVVRPYVERVHGQLLDEGQRLEKFETRGFIVEMRRPWHYALARTDEPAPPPVVPVDSKELKHFAEVLAAGHIVSSAPDELRQHELVDPTPIAPPPVLRWACCADPIHRSGSYHFATDWPHWIEKGQRCFDADSVRVATSLLSVQDQSFQVALRRLTASLTHNRLWSDCLVDAVIAWEALSGDCKGDVTFRVCSVIAHLISASGSRKAVRSILKKLYSSRSQVVHAGKILESSQSRDAAVLAGLVAIRRLKADPGILRESDRFSALCMHG